MSLLTGIILATSALSSASNVSRLLETSQLNRDSTCSDEAIDGFDVVVCKLWDRSVVNWPPAYIETRNISNPFDANCYNATLNDEVTALVCDYGDINIIHWPEGFLRSKFELNPNPFSTATEQGPRTPEETVDELLFNTPLDRFIASREKRDPVDLVWDSDGCTHAPDNPMGFGFLPACQRHDFGYRNYRAQNRLTKAAKKKINKQFKTDLHGICHKHLLRRPACKITAKLFYEAVKHNHVDDIEIARVD